MLRSMAGTSRFGIRAACAVAAALVLFFAAGALAADEPIQAATDRLEQIRIQLDRVEAAANRPDQRPDTLVRLREEIEPQRAALREIIAQLEPIHTQAEIRLKQLGEPPAADQPAESLAIASEREQQSITLRNADAALRQARLLATRGEQIVAGIDKQRRAAFTGLLFERSESFFAPALWLSAAAALPSELGSLRGFFSHWYDRVTSRVGIAHFAVALLVALAAVLAVLLLRAWVRRRFGSAATAGEEAVPIAESQRAMLAARDALVDVLAASAASIAVLEILSAFGLLPGDMRTVARSLVAAIILLSAGRALARAVLAPHNHRRRLGRFDDATARGLFRLITNATAVAAAALFLNELNRILTTSVALTVATSALFAALIALFIAVELLLNRASAERDDGGAMPPWIRLSGWLAASVIFVALASGYIRFASLVAERVVTAAIVLLALILLLALIDALFGEGLKQDSPRRRRFAATLGLQVKALDLFAALFAGILRTVFVLAAIFIVIGTLTTSTVDLTSAYDPAAFAIEFGEIRIGLGDVLGAFLLLLVGFAITRILYRWLSRDVLPRTELEASLQNSIATIAGYIAAIVVISLALGRLGVNLENIALVAGALSIGIGFGLQSIVSNFVSGLILLTERPIRVGDWVVVGNEQGYVRKISVRSTEIETFDRASVIVPNSDLISGVVKNWTHFNKLGRFSVPVGVAYNSDPAAVRDLLLEIASAHPLVLKTPAPNVFFLGFGDGSLQLDLRGFVADINQGFGVRSDLHFEIFRRFREAGIKIPFPQRDIHIRSAPAGLETGDESDEPPPPKRRRK